MFLFWFYYGMIINEFIQMMPRGKSEILVFLVRMFVANEQKI